MNAPTLMYFAFRGRAFACRIALFNSLGKEGWKDERVSFPRFQKALKPNQNPDRISSEFVTNNLPQLNLPCGLRVTQSHAIARYASKLPPISGAPSFELYPIEPREALIVDEAIAIVEQILLLSPKEADKSLRLQNRKTYAESGFLRVGMEVLEGRISTSGGPFILGKKLTIADLYVRAPLCDLFDLNQFEGVDRNYIDQFPLLKNCAESVMQHELIKKYHENYKN